MQAYDVYDTENTKRSGFQYKQANRYANIDNYSKKSEASSRKPHFDQN